MGYDLAAVDAGGQAGRRGIVGNADDASAVLEEVLEDGEFGGRQRQFGGRWHGKLGLLLALRRFARTKFLKPHALIGALLLSRACSKTHVGQVGSFQNDATIHGEC